jgi:hypothetical protein
MIRDEARAVKIAWASLPMTAVSALRPVMVQAGMHAVDADNGGKVYGRPGLERTSGGGTFACHHH